MVLSIDVGDSGVALAFILRVVELGDGREDVGCCGVFLDEGVCKDGNDGGGGKGPTLPSSLSGCINGLPDGDICWWRSNWWRLALQLSSEI